MKVQGERSRGKGAGRKEKGDRRKETGNTNKGQRARSREHSKK